MSDCIPARYITAAMHLIGALRDEGVDEIEAALREVDLRGLAITLAAMVPDDQTPSDLLAWNDAPQLPYEPPEWTPERRYAALHPTHSRRLVLLKETRQVNG